MSPDSSRRGRGTPPRVPSFMSDRELLARLRDGDESAFDAIFRAWYAPLVRMAEGMLRQRAVAEEVVQDVMLELWRRRETLAPDGSPQAYLFQATRNRALAEAEIDVAVKSAIATLPPRCREVFELSRMHGLKYAEIAQTLGVSVKAVEAQMGKALRTLRERLAPWLPRGDTL